MYCTVLYLNEEELGLADERLAAVSPEEAGEFAELDGSVSAVEHPLIPMAQQHAHE